MILPVKMMFMTRSELFELVLKFWKFLRVKTPLATLHVLRTRDLETILE